MTMIALLLLLGSQEIRFTDATREAGLVEPLVGMMGHGGAWGDFDGDGRIDLFVGGFCDRPAKEYAPAAGPVASKLLRNLGNGRFGSADQPAAEFYARTSGAVFADLDNDGDLELYAANNAKAGAGRGDEIQKAAQAKRCVLLRNDGGKLVDVSNESGACPENLLTARNIGIFDYDGDGLLDLFVVEDKFTKNPRSALLRNKGGLKFEDVTKAAGLPEDLFGLGLAVADLNGDFRPDFFLPHSNRLFLSDGKGGFAEALRDLFKHAPMDKEDWPCGAVFGDVDRDGDFDLVVTGHHDPAWIRLYLNDGKGGFREAVKEWGLTELIPTRAPHVELQDFDNDGWLDLYTSAAWIEEGKAIPLVYRNVEGKRLEPPRPIKGPMVYYPAGPTGDYDGDGRLDIFLINWFGGRGSVLLRNESPKRNWLQVRVIGRTGNRMGIGTRLRLGDKVSEMTTGYGYASGQPAVCHFGLGSATSVKLTVAFPNGKVATVTNPGVNQFLTVEEP
jgi:hypothetical protein